MRKCRVSLAIAALEYLRGGTGLSPETNDAPEGARAEHGGVRGGCPAAEAAEAAEHDGGGLEEEPEGAVLHIRGRRAEGEECLEQEKEGAEWAGEGMSKATPEEGPSCMRGGRAERGGMRGEGGGEEFAGEHLDEGAEY